MFVAHWIECEPTPFEFFQNTRTQKRSIFPDTAAEDNSLSAPPGPQDKLQSTCGSGNKRLPLRVSNNEPFRSDFSRFLPPVDNIPHLLQNALTFQEHSELVYCHTMSDAMISKKKISERRVLVTTFFVDLLDVVLNLSVAILTGSVVMLSSRA
jgi:hypothetical protein